MQIITNNKEKIKLNRLPIYDKADMIKVYEARYKKKPASDNELLDGLNSDDIDNMNKRYSLVSFFNFSPKNYSKTSDSFYPIIDNNHNVYMQGGCTDGVNLYYLFLQKDNSKEIKNAAKQDIVINHRIFDKSAIIKVHCGGIKKSNGDGKIYRYYVDKNEIKFNKFKNNIHDSFLSMAHHANDVVYIPDLPVLVNGKVVKKPYILVCGSFSFYLIDPNSLEVVNNNLIYLKGMLDLAGVDHITKLDFTLSRDAAYKKNITDMYNSTNSYDRYKIVGLTYNSKNKILTLLYNYIDFDVKNCKVGDKIDPTTTGQYIITYKFEDNPNEMTSTNEYLKIKPVYYKNGKYMEYYDYTSEALIQNLIYNPEGYYSLCGIDTDNTRVFHCRSNEKQSINRIYQFNPSYKNGLFDAYKLKKYYQVMGDDSFQFNEIENICYRILSSGNYRFFIGFKGYKYKSNEMKYGTILYYDCTPSQL